MKRLLIFSILLAGATISVAQKMPDIVFRHVNGTITWRSNKPCYECTVTLHHNPARGANTDSAGHFEFVAPNVPILLTIQDRGNNREYSVQLRPDESVLNIKLDEKAAKASEKIEMEWKKGNNGNDKKVFTMYQSPQFYRFFGKEPPRFGEPSIMSDEVPRDDRISETRIYTAVETEPKFGAGADDWKKYVSANLKVKEGDPRGKIFVALVVERDGSLSDPKILRGIGSDCDQEALRLVKSSPKWQPGMMSGKPVRCAYILVIDYNVKNQ